MCTTVTTIDITVPTPVCSLHVLSAYEKCMVYIGVSCVCMLMYCVTTTARIHPKQWSE